MPVCNLLSIPTPIPNYDLGVYSNFDPNYFKTQDSSYTTTNMGLIGTQGTLISICSSPATGPGFLVINHRGYLYETQTGTYTFTRISADEITDLWLGSSLTRNGRTRMSFRNTSTRTTTP
jgi:hypothetical protein